MSHELQYLKNRTRLMSICKSYIELCERETTYPSCKGDLMRAIGNEISSCHDEIALWTEGIVDFAKIAMRMVCTNSFDLLASGEYHLGAGFLNPLGPSRNLSHVHHCAIQWALEHGYCTEEDAKEDAEALRQAIKSL